MVAGLTIPEKAIVNLIETLQGITAGATYNRTLEHVRRCEDSMQINAYPTVVVTEIGTDNELVANPYVFANINLSLSIFDSGSHSDSWVQRTKLLVADIEHALRNTWSRGGNAEMTEVTRSTVFDAPRNSPFVVAECVVRIKTRFLYSDATSVAGTVP